MMQRCAFPHSGFSSKLAVFKVSTVESWPKKSGHRSSGISELRSLEKPFQIQLEVLVTQGSASQ